MQHCQIVLGLLLIPGGDSAKLLQPVDCSLHQTALPVQRPVERTSATFVGFSGDGVTNSPPSEIGPNPAAAVPFVAADPLRLDAGTATPGASHLPLSHQLLEHAGLVPPTPGSARRPPACPAPRLSDGLWSRTLPGSGPAPGRPPLFCPGSVLMCPHAGAVHIMDLPINLTGGISFLLHLSQKPVPQSLPPPPVETAGHGGPRAKALGQIPPWGPGTQNPQDTVDDCAMVLPRSSSPRLLSRQKRPQSSPLIIRQIPSSHTPHSSYQPDPSSLGTTIGFANTP